MNILSSECTSPFSEFQTNPLSNVHQIQLKKYEAAPYFFLFNQNLTYVNVIVCVNVILWSYPRTTDTQWRHKDIWKIGLMWQTKYAAAVPKTLGLGLNFWLCSEGYFFSRRQWSLELWFFLFLQPKFLLHRKLSSFFYRKA